jgi:hypothetical protein
MLNYGFFIFIPPLFKIIILCHFISFYFMFKNFEKYFCILFKFLYTVNALKILIISIWYIYYTWELLKIRIFYLLCGEFIL